MSAGFLSCRRGRNFVRRRKKRVRIHVYRWRDWLFSNYPLLITLVVALIVSSLVIRALEEQLRPVLLTAAKIQTENAVTVIAEEAILSHLEQLELEYRDFVQIERDEDGLITAITTDMAAINRLRSVLIEVILQRVSALDEKAIAIPVGSLIDSELLWGRGPTIKVRAFTIGTVSAEFRSEFLSAGVNQTLHKIWLDLSVPTTVLLPGSRVDISVDTMLCIAETVIVGKVPNYIQKI